MIVGTNVLSMKINSAAKKYLAKMQKTVHRLIKRDLEDFLRNVGS
jgi:hypothetical protein